MKNIIRLALGLAFLINANTAIAAEAIGTLTASVGEVFKLSGENHIPLKKGDAIFLHDTIENGKKSFAAITFIDNTTIDLGELAVLEVDEYIYNPKSNDQNAARYNITKGAFHYVSGLIAKKENPDVTLNLDFGSIGIRGTKIWRDMSKDENNNPMCRVYVEDGQADIFNKHGKVTLGHGEGTKIKGSDAAPTPTKAWDDTAINDIKSKYAAHH